MSYEIKLINSWFAYLLWPASCECALSASFALLVMLARFLSRQGEVSRVETASTDISGIDARCRWSWTTSNVCIAFVPLDFANKSFVDGAIAFSHCTGVSEPCLLDDPCFAVLSSCLSSSRALRLLRRGGGAYGGLSTLYRRPLFRHTGATVAVCRNCSRAAGSYTGIRLRVSIMAAWDTRSI